MISKFNIDILSCPSDECLFLALKILCISTRTLARSACSRGFSTKSFSVLSFQHNVIVLPKLGNILNIFCSTVKQNCSQVLLAGAISPYLSAMKSELLLTFLVWYLNSSPNLSLCSTIHQQWRHSPWQHVSAHIHDKPEKDRTLLPLILYFPWTKHEKNSGNYSLWTGYLKGKKTTKRNQTHSY